jgi:metallo-beta-lactamase family protein
MTHRLFLGAAGTVTGSKTLWSRGSLRILVDCGLFQGQKFLRLRNRDPLPIDPAAIDAVVLTHAHVDHSGYLPLLWRAGFRGPVFSTPATAGLCAILLPDAGRLQEEGAEDANRRRYSKHAPALPLYTEEDARECLELFEPLERGRSIRLGEGVALTLRHAGHILGAALAQIEADGATTLFSGDLGSASDPILTPPDRIRRTDWLVLESTYGNRESDRSHVMEDLATIVNRTIARGGRVLIPSFAVGRAQLVLYYLNELRRAGQIPNVPIFVNSPMAAQAAEVFCRHDDDTKLSEHQCQVMVRAARHVQTVEESKALDRSTEPCIIISASGMAAGGRVLHHLARLAPDPRNTVLFVGFQAAGTRGADMVAGAQSVRIHGSWVPIQADVEVLDGLSAHADAREILEWLGGFERAPRRTFLNHGEPAALEALKARIEKELGWTVDIPVWKQQAVLE